MPNAHNRISLFQQRFSIVNFTVTRLHLLLDHVASAEGMTALTRSRAKVRILT
jgi:hypothetical protein